MPRSAYKCRIEASYILNNQETRLDSNFIKYIMIENLYESRYMPVIYLSVAVSNELYTTILENEKTGKVYLSVYRYNIYSNSSIFKKYIEGQFTYILPSNDPNYAQELSDGTLDIDSSYRVITIGLISMDILNIAKTSFNGIYGEVDSNTLILKALEGLSAVVKQPLYNPYYDTIVIPAVNSKAKLLDFLFKECPFYDTHFMFFIDFVRAYLLDYSGEYCDAGDGQEKTVILDIREVTTEQSFYEGMEIQNNAYYIYMNPADTIVTENKSVDKITNQIVAINDDGNIDFVDLNINNADDSTVKQSFHRGNDIILYKNTLESNTIVIEAVKDNLDSSVLTPNKEYIVNNYKDYADYNGKYTLLYKKEVIKNTNGEFGVSVSLGLRKVGNITSIGTQVSRAASNRNSSVAYRYANTKTTTTTARKSNTGGTASGTTRTTTVASTKAIPEVTRMKATSNSSLKRTPTTLE